MREEVDNDLGQLVPSSWIVVGTLVNTRSRIPVDRVNCFQEVFGDVVLQ